MKFDVDLFIIGAGSGGIRAARFSAQFGARVAIAESRYLGGTCVNVGCIPKKILTYSSYYSEEFKNASYYGWDIKKPNFDWCALIRNKDKEIKRLNNLYHSILHRNNVLLYEGHATILDPHLVMVNDKKISARYILISTGSWPYIPNIPGHEHIITSNEIFFLKELPRKILIAGSGYIATELASILNGFGVETTQVCRNSSFLRNFDEDIQKNLCIEFRKKGINLQFNKEIIRIERKSNNAFIASFQDKSFLETDCILYATGRFAMIKKLGLENTSIKLDPNGFIKTNKFYQTSEKSVFAIGDVIGKIPLTPVAIAEGMAVAQYLFKKIDYQSVDYNLIPTTVFSLPSVSSVGLTTELAKKMGYKITVFESQFRPMKLSLTDNYEKIFIKLIVDSDTDKILGCHMIGHETGEILQGIAIALKAGITKRLLDKTIGIHPTIAEEIVTMRISKS